MRVLVLGPAGGPVAGWLTAQGETVIQTDGKLTRELLRETESEFVISYNYRHLISEEVIALLPERIINLHISYLPWNRGAHPNVWSFLDDTPKGVTIHRVDAGLDTGDILVRQEVVLGDDETLQSSYDKLHAVMVKIFRENWGRIKRGEIAPQPQTGIGSRHLLRDAVRFESLLREQGWGIPVRELKKSGKRLQRRTQNEPVS